MNCRYASWQGFSQQLRWHVTLTVFPSGGSLCMFVCFHVWLEILMLGGNAWGDLRDKMPKIARAEAKAWAKKACELIYKRRATLKGKQSPKTPPRTPGTPLLLTPSLTSPCYSTLLDMPSHFDDML